MPNHLKKNQGKSLKNEQKNDFLRYSLLLPKFSWN